MCLVMSGLKNGYFLLTWLSHLPIPSCWSRYVAQAAMEIESLYLSSAGVTGLCYHASLNVYYYLSTSHFTFRPSPLRCPQVSGNTCVCYAFTHTCCLLLRWGPSCAYSIGFHGHCSCVPAEEPLMWCWFVCKESSQCRS